MSHDRLRAERQRLEQETTRLFGRKPQPEAENAELRQLLEQSQALTREYDENLTEAEVRSLS